MFLFNLLIAGLLVYAFVMATRLPGSRPEKYLNKDPHQGTRVLTIGDSITHGAMSANYVKLLEHRFSGQEYSFINAGINAELVWNVLQRVDDIIACDPDYITILIGSNDVLATLSESRMKKYIRYQGIPREADRLWFEDNLRELILTLKNSTTAEIAVLSLPPVTEDPGHQGYLSAAEYSRTVKSLAEETGIHYLPLHEEMDKILCRDVQVRQEGIPFASHNMVLGMATVQRYIFRRSWNQISEKNGLYFLTDNIHLNERAADMIAGLIGDFLVSHPPSAR